MFLVAPSRTDARIAAVGRANRGFVYAAAVMGVTGARAQVGSRRAGAGRRVRALTDLPVGVGLGVSTGAQAAEVAAFADGVIVGSALVRRSSTAARTPCARSTAELADGRRRQARSPGDLSYAGRR